MDINELNFQLKYFYLINTDCLIENLKESDIYKSFKSDNSRVPDLFHLVFSNIIKATEPYTKFILSPNPAFASSLFGEVPGNAQTTSLFFLCEASLFHHCIVYGYKNSLNGHIVSKGRESTKPFLDLSSNDPVIKFSATTMPSIKKGCFYSFNSSQKYSPEYGSSEHQNFNGLCKRVLNNTDVYSTKLIYQLKVKPKGLTDNQLFTAKSESTPVAFLFDNDKVKSFNTVLKQKEIHSTPFLDKYTALCESYLDERSQLLRTDDQILFDIVLEKAYGFSLFAYVYRLLYQMNKDELSDKIMSLRGNIFYGLISDYIASLPITYNRSIFLKYACEAISNSDILSSMYLKTPEMAAYYETFTEKPILSFSTKALQIMDSFFRLLNYNVLPLLESLWFVLTYSLGIEFEDYQEFIHDNYSLITYDYTHLSTNIFSEEKSGMDFQNYYNILHGYIQSNSGSDPVELFSPAISISDYKLDAPYKYDFCNTLKKQCTIIDDSLRKDLIHHLLKPRQNQQENYSFEQQKFVNNHAKNIFEFTQSLDWNVLAQKKD